MTDFRRVTDTFSVAPQIEVEDVPLAAQAGFKVLVCNRPDGEALGQPSGAEMAEAARLAGLEFVHIPVVGGPTREQAEAFQAVVSEASGPVLAYCRSGTRSINTWALGQALAGAPTVDLIAAGDDAGYDLRPLLG